jgi:hypothetical protein
MVRCYASYARLQDSELCLLCSLDDLCLHTCYNADNFLTMTRHPVAFAGKMCFKSSLEQNQGGNSGSDYNNGKGNDGKGNGNENDKDKGNDGGSTMSMASAWSSATATGSGTASASSGSWLSGSFISG